MKMDAFHNLLVSLVWMMLVCLVSYIFASGVQFSYALIGDSFHQTLDNY